jgi:hypothetical protein
MKITFGNSCAAALASFVFLGSAQIALADDLVCTPYPGSPGSTAILHINPAANSAALGDEAASQATITSTQISWTGSTTNAYGFPNQYTFDRYSGKLTVQYTNRLANGSLVSGGVAFTCAKGSGPIE